MLTRSKLVAAIESGIETAGITGAPALLLRQIAAGTQRIAAGTFAADTDDGNTCGCPLTQARLYVDGEYVGIDREAGNAFIRTYDSALSEAAPGEFVVEVV